MKLPFCLSLLFLSPFLTGLTWDRSCQLGSGVQLRVDSKDGAHCAELDLDHDGDVDQSDYGIWQRSDEKLYIVIVLDLSLRSASDPEGCVRDALNARYAQRR